MSSSSSSSSQQQFKQRAEEQQIERESEEENEDSRARGRVCVFLCVCVNRRSWWSVVFLLGAVLQRVCGMNVCECVGEKREIFDKGSEIR